MNETTKKQCDNCHKVFGTNTRKREYKRRIIDPLTNKVLLVCNACGLLLRRALWKSSGKPKKQLRAESDDVWDDVSKFIGALQIVLDDKNANRLYCPVTTPKVCNCIQRFVTDSRSNKHLTLNQKCEDLINKEKAVELNELHKKAKELVQMKVPRPNKVLTVNEVRGVIHRRTKQFDDFVFANRERLKRELRLCERATQRVLCYSNNYLHKQLKTLPNGEARIVRKNGWAGRRSLVEMDQVAKVKCCRRWCTRLVLTHRRVVDQWRSRTLLSRHHAASVLGEMLTPAAGDALNCFTFIQLVTGCTESVYAKTKRALQTLDGIRSPCEHGLREYWRRKKAEKTNKVADRVTHTHTSVITRNVNIGNGQEQVGRSECTANESEDGVVECVGSMLCNSVSVISRTVDVMNGGRPSASGSGVGSNGTVPTNETLPILLTDVGYNVEGVCESDKRATWNLLSTPENAANARLLTVPTIDLAQASDVTNENNEENVQYIEITNLAGTKPSTYVPDAREGDEDEESKYVFIVPPPNCLLVTMDQ